MVEYAVLLGQHASNTFSLAASHAVSWAADLNWNAIGYTVAAFLLLRIVIGAFKPKRRSR